MSERLTAGERIILNDPEGFCSELKVICKRRTYGMEADPRRNIVHGDKPNRNIALAGRCLKPMKRFRKSRAMHSIIHKKTINLASLHKSRAYRRAEEYRAENSAGAQKLMANLFTHAAEILDLGHFLSHDLSPRKHASHCLPPVKRSFEIV